MEHITTVNDKIKQASNENATHYGDILAYRKVAVQAFQEGVDFAVRFLLPGMTEE